MSLKQEQPKFVAYLRVSTARQGKSGLGIDAQREAVRQLVTSRSGRIIAPEFVEIESGKVNHRPQLLQALKRCRMTGATLVVAKLDRLSRNAAFLMTLKDSGVHFVAADCPEANTLTIGILALVAQNEREAISTRTKDALAAAKRRGTTKDGRPLKLGNPQGTDAISRAAMARGHAASLAARRAKVAARLADIGDLIRAMRREGLSLNAMAARLDGEGITTARGASWTAMAVKRALDRLPSLASRD